MKNKLQREPHNRRNFLESDAFSLFNFPFSPGFLHTSESFRYKIQLFTAKVEFGT